MWVDEDGVWKSSFARVPTGGQQANFETGQNTVSCPRIRACVAIGSYTQANGLQRGFLEQQSP